MSFRVAGEMPQDGSIKDKAGSYLYQKVGILGRGYIT